MGRLWALIVAVQLGSCLEYIGLFLLAVNSINLKQGASKAANNIPACCYHPHIGPEPSPSNSMLSVLLLHLLVTPNVTRPNPTLIPSGAMAFT